MKDCLSNNKKNKKGKTTMKVMNMMVAVCVAAVLAMLMGCDKPPSAEVMKTTATSVGVAAGLVANETKLDEKAKTTIVAIVSEVKKVTPDVGQTFEAAWTPVAQELVAKLIAEGKIDEGIGNVSLLAFGVATKGIDYLFDVRFPKAREYKELVSAAIEGFSGGFLSVFTPVDEAKGTKVPEPDKDAMKWLKENAKPKAK